MTGNPPCWGTRAVLPWNDSPRCREARHLRGGSVTGRPAARAAHPPAAGYPHDALLFDSTAQLVDLAVPFVREGLAAGEAAVVATSPDTASALRDAVDDP